MRAMLLALGLMLALAVLAPPLPAAGATGPATGASQAWAQGEPQPRPGSRPPAARRVLGYYVPYDPHSWATVESQAHALDLVAVQWVTIDACGRLISQDNQTITRFAQAQGIAVLPSLLTFSGWLNNRLLTDPETTQRALDQIVEYVESEGYDGFDLDLEGVRLDDGAAYTTFVQRLGAALHERGKLLTLAIPARSSDITTGWAGAYDYAALGPHADLITVMAYEFHGSWGEPGPIAPYDGVEKVAAYATAKIPPEKVLLGMAFYGFDWNTTSGGARYLGYPEAAALAERYGAPIELDPVSKSARLRYRAPAGEPPPLPPRPPALQHEITERTPPACPSAGPRPRRDAGARGLV